MADGYGNGIGNWRCHVAAWVTSYDDTSDVIHVEARWQAFNGWYYVGWVAATVWVNGQQVNHTDNSGTRNTGTNGEVTVLTGDLRVAKTEGSRNITCSASIYFNGVHTGTSNASCGVPVGGIRYHAPRPPKNVNWSRVDDSATNLTWTGDYDGGYPQPWKQVIIDRIIYPDGATAASWGNVTTLGWNATNYRATGQKPNSKIGYSVYARNQAGDSSHVNLTYLYTTPTAPATVSAVKSGASTVTVSVDASKTFAYRLQVQRSLDSQTWEDVGEVQIPSNGKTSWEDAEAPAGTVHYRARYTRPVYGDDTGRTILYSEWTASNSVTTITPPSAPTIINPTQGVTYDITKTLTVSWTPNHPDGSAQSSAEIQIESDNNKYSRTFTVTGSTTDLTVTDLSTVGDYTVRVRTKGLHADWGAWSGYVSFDVREAPSVVVTRPNADITSSPFTVEWSVSDRTGVSQQRVTISAEGIVRYTTLVDVSKRSLTITAAEYLPNNNARLTVTVTVRGGSGLTSSGDTLQIVKYTPPAEPAVDVTPDDDYAAHITIAFGIPKPGEPQTEYASVTRILPDGSTLLIADHLTDNQQTVDPLPPLNLDYTYQVTAHAASGAVSSTTHTVSIPADFAILNFGSDAGEALRFAYNMTVSHRRSHVTSEYHFARGTGGDAFPSSYELDQTDGTINVVGVWEWDQAWYLRMLSLADEYAYAWYREPSGFRAYVKAEQSVDVDVTDRKNISYSADLTRLTWEEPVR